jgi:hypothetical protein
MKKEATPKHNGFKTKTSDEKMGNPKMHKGIKMKAISQTESQEPLNNRS